MDALELVLLLLLDGHWFLAGQFLLGPRLHLQEVVRQLL